MCYDLHVFFAHNLRTPAQQHINPLPGWGVALAKKTSTGKPQIHLKKPVQAPISLRLRQFAPPGPAAPFSYSKYFLPDTRRVLVPPRFELESVFLYHIKCHLAMAIIGVHGWSQSCSVHWALAWGKPLGSVGIQGGAVGPRGGGRSVAKPTETKQQV
jgi:hypothetical protein